MTPMVSHVLTLSCSHMTPVQYHFPYFIEFSQFDADLAPFQWIARIEIPQNKNESEILVVEPQEMKDETRKVSTALRFDFGTFLMVQGHLLFAWRRYRDGLLIRQYDLREADPQISMLEEFVDIAATDPGTHAHSSRLAYQHFVTFIRKPNLTVHEDYHERYVIVMLHEETITIIPFASFNETGGDPLYMWPALATLDPDTGKLYGHGMRMGSFTVQV
jgi:hypothetical protein